MLGMNFVHDFSLPFRPEGQDNGHIDFYLMVEQIFITGFSQAVLHHHLV